MSFFAFHTNSPDNSPNSVMRAVTVLGAVFNLQLGNPMLQQALDGYTTQANNLEKALEGLACAMNIGHFELINQVHQIFMARACVYCLEMSTWGVKVYTAALLSDTEDRQEVVQMLACLRFNWAREFDVMSNLCRSWAMKTVPAKQVQAQFQKLQVLSQEMDQRWMLLLKVQEFAAVYHEPGVSTVKPVLMPAGLHYVVPPVKPLPTSAGLYRVEPMSRTESAEQSPQLQLQELQEFDEMVQMSEVAESVPAGSHPWFPFDENTNVTRELDEMMAVLETHDV